MTASMVATTFRAYMHGCCSPSEGAKQRNGRSANIHFPGALHLTCSKAGLLIN